MSDYLDNMDVPEGHKLRCVSNLGSDSLSLDAVYTVTYRDNIAGVISDDGLWIIPSARFIWAYKRKKAA